MSDNELSLFLPITKVDEEKRLVYLRAAQEIPDRANEIMDYQKSRPYFEKWSQEQHEASMGKSYGNVRAMHQNRASGIIAEPLSFNDVDKAIDVVVKVTDDEDWRKCKDGTYTGGSIGGSYGERTIEKSASGKNLTRYVAMPNHLALADRPCIPTATFRLIKADGTEQDIPFKTGVQQMHSAAVMIEMIKAHGEENGQRLLDAYSSEELVKMDQAAQVAAIAKLNGGPEVKPELAKEDLEKKEFSPKEREKLADEGKAMPGGGFPIENEADLKNAIQAIGRAKDPEAAKAHIKDRAKALGLTALIPEQWGGEEAKKADDTGELTKDDNFNEVLETNGEAMDVQQALSALMTIQALMEGEQDENHPEDAAQLTQLKLAITAIKEFIASEIKEDNSTAKADESGDLEKIGAKIGRGNMEKLQGAHDHLVAMGAKCMKCSKCEGDISAVKTEEVGDLAKLADDAIESLRKTDDEMRKIAETLTKLDQENDALKKRVEELEAEPAEGKAFLKVVAVSKEDDQKMTKQDAGPSADDLAKMSNEDRLLLAGGHTMSEISKMDQDAKVMALMKVSLSFPVTRINLPGMQQGQE